MSILAITNANAKDVAKNGPRISQPALPVNSVHHVTQSLTDLSPVLANAAKQSLRHLVIEGGDGTVRTVMTELLTQFSKHQPLPAITILPSGTTNQIARNLGIKKLEDITAIANGHTAKTVMPMVKIKSKTQNTRVGFLFSTGALPHVSRFAQNKLNANGVGGSSAVIGAVIKAITSDKDKLMPPEKHRLKAKTGLQTIINHKGPALGTIMTTLPTLMLGLDPFWGDEHAPLRLTWAKADSGKLGRTVAGLWAGRKQDRSQDGYYSHNIDKLTLKTDAPATLDGDFLDIQNQKLRISASRPITFWQAK